MGFWNVSPDWHVAILLLTGMAIVYTLRINMSVAVVDMADDFDWSDGQKGLVLSMFYVGYAVGQVPSSLFCLANTRHLRKIYAMSIVLPSLCTLVTPLFAEDFGVLLMLRILTGLGESATFPATFQFYIMLGTNAERRTKMVSTIMSGAYVGTIVGFLFSGLLCSSDIWIHDGGSDRFNVGRWPALFYSFGLVGLAFGPFFLYTCPALEVAQTYSRAQSVATDAGGVGSDLGLGLGISPSEAMWLNKSENEDMGATTTTFKADAAAADADRDVDAKLLGLPTFAAGEDRELRDIFDEIPWRAILTNRTSVVLLLNGYNYGWLAYLIMSELPTFLVEQLGTSVRLAGILSVVIYTLMLMANLTFGRLFARMQTEYGWATSKVRHVAQTIGIGVSCIFLVCASFASAVPWLSVLCLALSQMTLSAIQSGLACSYLEVTSQYSGLLNAVSNLFTSLGGVLSPLFVAVCLDSGMTAVWAWRTVFIVTAVQSTGALYLYVTYFKPGLIKELCDPSPYWVRKHGGRLACSGSTDIHTGLLADVHDDHHHQ